MNPEKQHDQLDNMSCTPCKGGVDPLALDQIRFYMTQLSGEWQLIDNHHLERTFPFKNFKQALEFTNQIGEIAESQGHHPDIFLSWGKVKVSIWTHKIGGLHRNDFILAKKIESINP